MAVERRTQQEQVRIARVVLWEHKENDSMKLSRWHSLETRHENKSRQKKLLHVIPRLH